MATTARFSNRMNESDTTLWQIERDPALRTTILAVAMLDEAPAWAQLRARFVEAVEAVPRLRQRVVSGPNPFGPPRWAPDPAFDLDYHLRRAAAPAPGDLRAVLDLAAPLYMTGFDRERPLWEFTLVEGLAGGRAAFVQKIHHSLTDGVGGVELAERLLEQTPAAASTDDGAPVEPGPAPAAPSGTGLPVMAVAEDVRDAVSAMARMARAVPEMAGAATFHPQQFARQSVRTVRSIGKLMAPARVPRSPVMVGRGAARRFDVLDIPLEGMLAAAHAVDASLNDAYLAAVTGGLRRYHELHRRPVDTLRVTMPVNLRQDGDGMAGNRFTPVRFTLPVAIVDPAERMRHLGGIARAWRKEPALPLTELIAGTLNRLPAPVTVSVLGSMLKAIDFVATNVPGPTGTRYLAGARVRREYAFAPPSGAAFAVALLSFDETCCIGLTMDTVAVADPAVLAECIHDGFEEVLAVGGGRS